MVTDEGMTLYVLWHNRDGDTDNAKLIGIYSSPDKVKATQSRFSRLPGFAEYPDDYLVDEYSLDEDNWTDGFVTD